MVFIDTNIFMYAAGKPHPHKLASLGLLHTIAARKIEACTNVEVLQEILHRYRAINRWEDGREVFELVRRIIPVVYPINEEILCACCDIMNANSKVIARDALHIAFCLQNEIDTIYSFDADLDGFEGIKRLEPNN